MKGKVIQTTGSWYRVLCEDNAIREARLKGKFKTSNFKFTNPIAVGDDVILINADDEQGVVISEILERRNYIVRQSPRKKFHQHIIASNIDQALLITSIHQPRTSLGFIDRFLVAAASFHINVRILVNKIDLLKEKHFKILEEWKAIYTDLGFELYTASIETGEGMDAVAGIFKGKATLLAGHSGVGKSSLINWLAPGANIKINEISEKYSKGKHTTTYATMHQLYDDTFIIDTPGIKEFGLSQIEPEELSGYFVEMNALAGKCKYNNCLHRDEPGCSVKEAVAEGRISESRFMNYLQMLESLEGINYWERS